MKSTSTTFPFSSFQVSGGELYQREARNSGAFVLKMGDMKEIKQPIG